MSTQNAAVEATLTQVRSILATGIDRSRLEQVKEALIGLAGQSALWSDEHFPDPAEDEKQVRYLITQDTPQGLSLYLNVMRPGKKIPPHDHTTWACVAAVVGVEHNKVFKRDDDGSEPGRAKLTETREVSIEPGSGIALMAEDIHQVEIRGDEVIRHLHMYGRPLETLTGRTMYDLEAGTCHQMDIGVKTR